MVDRGRIISNPSGRPQHTPLRYVNHVRWCENQNETETERRAARPFAVALIRVHLLIQFIQYVYVLRCTAMHVYECVCVRRIYELYVVTCAIKTFVYAN